MRSQRLASLKTALSATLLLVASTGCASSQWSHDERREAIEQPTVVLMPMDIELYLLTVGGVLEPRADWTEAAVGFALPLVEERLAQSSAETVVYRTPEAERLQQHEQLQKLHEVVGWAIRSSKRIWPAPPPTVKDKFDWTLGEEARVIAEDSGADYALFIYVRDSYASTSRQVVMASSVLVGVFTGIPIGLPGGHQLGFASLVDLRDGDIMWFKRLSSASGDLRKEGPAKKVIEELLKEIPL